MKFNEKKAVKTVRNFDGFKAYAKSAKLELVQAVLSSFVQDTYYTSADVKKQRIAKLVHKVDPEFAMKLAIFARDEFNMRSTSHIVAGELAAIKGVPKARNFFKKVVVRPDDMLEIASYYNGTYGATRKNGKVKLPESMKKGFKGAFDKFDGYSLSKYRGENKGMKLIDLVNLVGPVPTDRNGQALSELVADKLRAAETWETKLTQAGQAEGDTDELKNAAWKDLISNKKLKAMALLRNLRNISQQAPEMLPEALKQLKTINKERILPFRFYSAYKELSDNNRVVNTLSKAIDYADVPEFLEDSLIAIDVSASMTFKMSNKSTMSHVEVAAFMASVLAKRGYADVMIFSHFGKYVPYRTADSVFTNTEKIMKEAHHGCTDFEQIFMNANKAYKRIIIMSDMQANMGARATDALKEYKKKYKCDPMVYCWDLAGHGTMQFPENRVAHLAGFSEKCFDIMNYMEQDPNALIHRIEAVEL